MDERLCAVDGVEDPAESAPARPLGKLLAIDAVLGKRRGDALPQVFFRPAIGRRDRRVVALQLHIEVVAAEVFERNASRLACSRKGQVKSRLEVGVG